MPEHQVTLHEVTIQSLRRAVDSVHADGIEPDTIDLPDLLRAMTDVAAARPLDSEGAPMVLALLRLAALALLWSQSADDLGDILAGLPADDDPAIEALLADFDRQRSARPALGERSGEGS